jgi:hypothetical protein
MKLSKTNDPLFEAASMEDFEEMLQDDTCDFYSRMYQASKEEWPYACIILQNKPMMLEFLEKSGLLSLGDKYIDGEKAVPLILEKRRPRYMRQIPQKLNKAPTEGESDCHNRQRAENNRFEDAVDSAFWFCLLFPDEEKKRQGLEKIGIPGDSKFYDGMLLAEQLGIQLETEIPPMYRQANPWKELSELAMPLTDIDKSITAAS